MKKWVLLAIALITFGGIQAAIAKCQIDGAGMTVANSESYGRDGGGGPKSGND